MGDFPLAWIRWRRHRRRAGEAGVGVLVAEAVHPGGLTDDAGTGQVEIGENVEGSIPRADVAHLVAELIMSGRGVRQQFEVVSGPTPIAELPL